MGSHHRLVLRKALGINYGTTAMALAASLHPFIRAFGEKMEKGYELDRAVRSLFKEYPHAADAFTFRPGRKKRKFHLREDLIYLRSEVVSVFLRDELSDRIYSPDIEAVDLGDFLIVLSAAASGRFTRGQLLRMIPPRHGRIKQQMLRWFDDEILIEQARDKTGGHVFERPGLYRLQHACLLFRSRSTGIIVDPHLRSDFQLSGLQSGHAINPEEVIPWVDAIVISHSHEDHFHIPTLLMFPRDTPIIVPRVKRSTLICDHMQSRLKNYGFTRVLAPSWYSKPIRFGDISIRALPFYGEQPLNDEWPAFDDVWNMGNTYLVETPDFRAWFLIDSGNDVRGKASDVAKRLHREGMQIDVLLSNLYPFLIRDPFYINHGLNWLTLSAEQMRRLPLLRGQSLTLGPKGVAEVCAMSRAKLFLPYAHWWEHSRDALAKRDRTVVTDLGLELQKLGSMTRVGAWGVGDRYLSGA